MPELPEVEVVRRGLQRWVAGRTISSVEVHHPRAVRRHLPGERDFVAGLVARTVTAARRRGKYLWLPLDSGDAIVGHLGMSGQLLVLPPDAPAGPHLRLRIGFTDTERTGTELRFVDQRTFGGLMLSRGDAELPAAIAHIARDPLDAEFDAAAVVAAMRRRHTTIKRALLDQSLISGIGNIYADESLWRARLHHARPVNALPARVLHDLLGDARTVMEEALRAGGTSFDSLYVDVNGSSGYFERSLAVYGREGKPCERCGTPIRREPFMNRSSFFCPRCQRPPRTRAAISSPPARPSSTRGSYT